jgi:hypothetical protein
LSNNNIAARLSNNNIAARLSNNNIAARLATQKWQHACQNRVS